MNNRLSRKGWNINDLIINILVVPINKKKIIITVKSIREPTNEYKKKL
jgi:hypothetical protein